jgi:hypothetical protein
MYKMIMKKFYNKIDETQECINDFRRKLKSYKK